MLTAIILNSAQVLLPLFPPILLRRPGLRMRAYHFSAPPYEDDKNYIPRVLNTSVSPNLMHQMVKLVYVAGFPLNAASMSTRYVVTIYSTISAHLILVFLL